MTTTKKDAYDYVQAASLQHPHKEHKIWDEAGLHPHSGSFKAQDYTRSSKETCFPMRYIGSNSYRQSNAGKSGCKAKADTAKRSAAAYAQQKLLIHQSTAEDDITQVHPVSLDNAVWCHTASPARNESKLPSLCDSKGQRCTQNLLNTRPLPGIYALALRQSNLLTTLSKRFQRCRRSAFLANWLTRCFKLMGSKYVYIET